MSIRTAKIIKWFLNHYCLAVHGFRWQSQWKHLTLKALKAIKTLCRLWEKEKLSCILVEGIKVNTFQVKIFNSRHTCAIIKRKNCLIYIKRVTFMHSHCVEDSLPQVDSPLCHAPLHLLIISKLIQPHSNWDLVTWKCACIYPTLMFFHSSFHRVAESAPFSSSAASVVTH